MAEGELTPAQAKFFSAHINGGLLNWLWNKTDLAFAAAFQAYRDAEKAARPALTNLPMYPGASAEAVEKDALISRYSQIEADTMSGGKNQKTAIAACIQGKSGMDSIIAAATALMDKAISDVQMPDPDRIILLKQRGALHLNANRDALAADAAPVMAEIAEKAGTDMPLPVMKTFEAGLEDLRREIAAVTTDGQPASAAKTKLEGIMAQSDQLLARARTELAAYAGSDAMVATIEIGQLDAALRSGLKLAARNAEQMTTWGVDGAKAAVADAEMLAKRGAPLLGKSVYESKTAAATATAARRDLQADIDRLNATCTQALDAKREGFSDLFVTISDRFAQVSRDFQAIDDIHFAKGQKTPIQSFLDLTSTAINNLNGFNTGALVAAGKLVDQAVLIVNAAQNATQINAHLKETLAGMSKTLVQGGQRGKPLQARFDEMKAEHASLSTKWQTMLLSEAQQAVADFATRLAEEVALEAAIEARRATARAELTLAKADLAQFDTAYRDMLKSQGRKVKSYEGPEVADIATAQTWIDTKTSLGFYDTIDAMLNRVRSKLAAMMAGLAATGTKSDTEIYAEATTLLAQLEKISDETKKSLAAKGIAADLVPFEQARATVDAQLAQLTTRRDLLEQDDAAARLKEAEAARKATYLADAGAYVITIRAQIKAAAPGSAFEQFKEDVDTQLARIEASIKAVQKGGPAAPAQSELAFLTGTVDGIRARGPKTDTHNLDQIGRQWADAVTGFAVECTSMQAAVAKYLQDNQQDAEYSVALSSLETALAEVQTRLAPSAFNRVSDRFRDPAEFKSAREETLQTIRYFNELLLKDPVVQQCVMNPFGVRSFGSALVSRLRQIELEVLRAA
jgi:hypothetical protein